jgi:hypothetical protein
LKNRLRIANRVTRISLFRASGKGSAGSGKACGTAFAERGGSAYGLNEASKNLLTDCWTVCIISFLCCKRSGAGNTGGSEVEAGVEREPIFKNLQPISVGA